MKLWTWIAGAVLVGALVWGVEQVVVSPLETGDVYPAFSSLRSDPMGTRALYESLAETPGITVERLYKERTELSGSNDVMFVLGVDPVSWSGLKAKELEAYEKLVANGGRLVIGFLPVREPGRTPIERAVEEKWSIRLRYHRQDPDAERRTIPRESALYFEAGREWRTGRRIRRAQFRCGDDRARRRHVRVKQ